MAREVARGLLPLRPLRILKRAPGIRVVLGSVMAAVPSIKNIMILSWFLWYLWGAVGVQLFAGSFYSCTDPEITLKANCTAAGETWRTGPYNFDNIGNAMSTLYIITTFSDWTEIVYQGVDAVGPGEAPVLNYNPAASIYFLVFAVIGGIFFVNLFVSVLIDTYEEQRKKMAGGGSVFLTAEQNAWMTSHRNVIDALPPPEYSFRQDSSDEETDEDHPDGARRKSGLDGDEDYEDDASEEENPELIEMEPVLSPNTNNGPGDFDGAGAKPRQKRTRRRHVPWWLRFRRNLAVLVQTNKFTNFINVCIILNFVVNAQDHYPIEENWDLALMIANSIFIAIFTLEVLIKIIAFGPRLFVSSKWNLFDLCVVVVSLGGLILEIIFARRSFGSSFRTLRLVRLLRLVKATKRVQAMIVKLGFALYALNNVAALILVVFCVGALLGMRLFSRIHWDYDVINHNANFTEFTQAALMMLRLATLDNWNDVMAACGVGPPDCDPHLGDCGRELTATVYFMFCTWLFTVVLLNIFVAVIIDTFNSGQGGLTGSSGGMGLTEMQINRFVVTWLKFDPKRTLMLRSTNVVPFLMALPVTHPFAPPRDELEHRQPLANFRFLFSLDLMESAPGYVDLWELLSGLCRSRFRAGAPSPAQLERLRNKYNRKNPRYITQAGGGRVRQRLKQIGANLRLIRDGGATNSYADGRMPVAVRVAAHLVLERFRMAKRRRQERAREAVAKEREDAARAALQQRVEAWADGVIAAHGGLRSSFDESIIVPMVSVSAAAQENDDGEEPAPNWAEVDAEMRKRHGEEIFLRSATLGRHAALVVPRAAGQSPPKGSSLGAAAGNASSRGFDGATTDIDARSELIMGQTVGAFAAAGSYSDMRDSSSMAGPSPLPMDSAPSFHGGGGYHQQQQSRSDFDHAQHEAAALDDIANPLLVDRRHEASAAFVHELLSSGDGETAGDAEARYALLSPSVSERFAPAARDATSAPSPHRNADASRLERRAKREQAASQAVDELIGASPPQLPREASSIATGSVASPIPHGASSGAPLLQVPSAATGTSGSGDARAETPATELHVKPAAAASSMVARLGGDHRAVASVRHDRRRREALAASSPEVPAAELKPIDREQLHAAIERLQRRAPERPAPVASPAVQRQAAEEAQRRLRVHRVLGYDEYGYPVSRRRDPDSAASPTTAGEATALERAEQLRGVGGGAASPPHLRVGSVGSVGSRHGSLDDTSGASSTELASEAGEFAHDVANDAEGFLRELLDGEGVPVGGHRGDRRRRGRRFGPSGPGDDAAAGDAPDVDRFEAAQEGTLGGMLARIRAARRLEQTAGLPPDAQVHRALLHEYTEHPLSDGSHSSDSEATRARRRIQRHLRAGEAQRSRLTVSDLVRLHRHRPQPVDADDLARIIHDAENKPASEPKDTASVSTVPAAPPPRAAATQAASPGTAPPRRRFAMPAAQTAAARPAALPQQSNLTGLTFDDI